MKRFCCIVLVILICFGVFGCSSQESKPTETEPVVLGTDPTKPADVDPTVDPTEPDDEQPDVDPTKPEDEEPDVDPTEPDDEEPDVDPTIPDDEKPDVDPTEPDDEETNVDPTEPDDEQPNEDQPFPSDDYYPVFMEEPDFIYGRITAKLSTNILVVKLDQLEYINDWGKFVYIICDETDIFCVGEEIFVNFSQVERPNNESEYVKLIADDICPVAVPMKPIIYLYPETPTECSLKLTLNGKFTCTYPDHGKSGWNDFTAYPDGTLIFQDGKEYYALYWEGIQNTEWDFSQGFCVPGEDTARFLEWALAEQGLTRREANEFVVYWLPLMQNNPYNVISFQTDAYTDGAVLDIDPAPDSLIRVFMAFYASDSEVEIEPQSFDTFQREGFTVVEWGGSQAKMP